MIRRLKARHYKSKFGFVAAAILLALLRQDKDAYMAENINFSLGYSYYFFARRKT